MGAVYDCHACGCQFTGGVADQGLCEDCASTELSRCQHHFHTTQGPSICCLCGEIQSSADKAEDRACGAFAPVEHCTYRVVHVHGRPVVVSDDGYRIRYLYGGEWRLWAEYKHSDIPDIAYAIRDSLLAALKEEQ